ncbi:MAG: hypothetical protein ACQEXJ_23850 [Myxococcota bacterium]
MTKSTGWLWGGALVLLIGLAPAGCKKDEPAEEPTTTEAEAPAEEPEAAGAADAEAATERGAAEAADAGAAEKPLTGKEKLAEAYVEIYCAQRKGETEKLLEIYTKYGFEDPRAWTEAWTEAAEDEPWVARITQRAVRECP